MITNIHGAPSDPCHTRFMCTECHRHRGVNGPRCLYCQGLNPPKPGYHRLFICLRSFMRHPINSLHQIPSLCR